MPEKLKMLKNVKFFRPYRPSLLHTPFPSPLQSHSNHWDFRQELSQNSASHVNSLPSTATVVICAVAVVAVSAGADAAAVGAISGRVVLIAVVVNDNTGVVSKQTAGIE